MTFQRIKYPENFGVLLGLYAGFCLIPFETGCLIMTEKKFELNAWAKIQAGSWERGFFFQEGLDILSLCFEKLQGISNIFQIWS